MMNDALDTLQYNLEEEVRVRSGPMVNGAYKTHEEYRESVGYVAGLRRAIAMITIMRDPQKPKAKQEEELVV